MMLFVYLFVCLFQCSLTLNGDTQSLYKYAGFVVCGNKGRKGLEVSKRLKERREQPFATNQVEHLTVSFSYLS